MKMYFPESEPNYIEVDTSDKGEIYMQFGIDLEAGEPAPKSFVYEAEDVEVLELPPPPPIEIIL